MKDLCEWVEKNEKDTVRYLCGKVTEEGKTPYFITQETYGLNPAGNECDENQPH